MNRLGLTIGIMASAITATPVIAQVTTFSDRLAFANASGSLTTEGLESFVIDTEFRSAPVDVGAFTVGLTGAISPFTEFNRIEVAPGPFNNPNSTNYINALVTTGSSLFLTFDSAIVSFGADFGSWNDGVRRSDLYIDGLLVTTPVAPQGGNYFFGLRSMSAFSSVEFRGVINDGFGIDNISFGAGSVPEPASWALMIGGFGLAGGRLRRRRMQTTVAFG